MIGKRLSLVHLRLNISDWSESKCLAIVARSTVTFELGNMTGSNINVDIIGSKKSSGASVNASWWAFSSWSNRFTFTAKSLISPINCPPPIRTTPKKRIKSRQKKKFEVLSHPTPVRRIQIILGCTIDRLVKQPDRMLCSFASLCRFGKSLAPL